MKALSQEKIDLVIHDVCQKDSDHTQKFGCDFLLVCFLREAQEFPTILNTTKYLVGFRLFGP